MINISLILLLMRDISGRSCREIKIYGTTRRATDDSIIRRMRFACWITKAADIHSEYEAYLHERTTMLRYTYNDSPVD